jgi:RNA polymerase-interacting CarD/CdnL/TRCF family regulator
MNREGAMRVLLTGVVSVVLGGSCASSEPAELPRVELEPGARRKPVSTKSEFKVGDHVVWRGQGLARIESIEKKGSEEMLDLVILGSGMKVGLAKANADGAIRHVLDRDAAAGVWADLKKPADADMRTWEDRSFDYTRTLVKGTVQDQVARLRRMYSSTFEPTMGERRFIYTYEELLFSELGYVLGRPTGDLRAEMQSLHAVFSATAERPREPQQTAVKPAGPTVRGFDLLGPFEIEGGLVVADPTYISSHADKRGGLNHRIPALGGTWYGYAADDKKMGRTGLLVAVHASKVPAKHSLLEKSPLAALQKQAHVVATIRVDGGRMTILDQSVRDEERFEDELFFRGRNGTVLGRGCTTESGYGDGTYPVSVVLEDGEAVYVQVDFR